MTAPWDSPPPPDRRGHKDFIGRSVLTIVGGVRYGVQTQYGAQDIPHVSIVSLAGADAGNVYTDIHVYTTRIAGRLRACEPGKVVLSKVVDAGKAPDLADPDQWDQAAATAWMNANPGALDALRQGAVIDFHNSVSRTPTGGASAQQPAQPQYQQPAMFGAPTTSAAPQQYAQAQPQYQQPQYAQPQPPQQQYAPPPQQQSGPPAPPSWQPPPQQNDGPPTQPPPQTYQPQGNATLASMTAAPADGPQSDTPPF